MGRRRSQSSTKNSPPPRSAKDARRAAVSKGSAAPAPESKKPALIAAEKKRAAQERKTLSPKFWIGLYIAVFLIFQAVIIGATMVTGGKTREMRKMLLEAERFEQAEQWDRAIAQLEKFANREEFRGAWESDKFLRRLGEAYFEAENFEKAAPLLEKSARLQPENNPETRAMAGVSYWNLGDRDRAIALLKGEIDKGDAANELANYYLGVHELEQGDPKDAFARFQALDDPDKWSDNVKTARREAEEKFFGPARESAKELLAKVKAGDAEPPRTSSSDRPTTRTAETR
ncbi:MAG: hypothetical protein RLY93_00520 [Sumerlaeia bacterium]